MERKRNYDSLNSGQSSRKKQTLTASQIKQQLENNNDSQEGEQQDYSQENTNPDILFDATAIREIIQTVDISLHEEGTGNNSDSSNEMFGPTDDEDENYIPLNSNKTITTAMNNTAQQQNDDENELPTVHHIEDSSSSSESDQNSKSSSSKTKKSTKGGRNRDPVWNQFSEKKKGETQVQCKSCKTYVSVKVERLRVHFIKCAGVDAKTVIPSKANAFVRNPVLVSSPSTSSSSSSVRLPPKSISSYIKKNNKQSDIRNHLDIMSTEEKQMLDYKLGKFIYSSNSPFRVVENPFFIEFVKSLRPAYEPPKEVDVGGKILDTVYEDINELMIKELKGKNVTIMQDGWSTNRNAPVIAHCLSTGSKIFFLDAVPTKENKKGADYCKALLLKAIEKAEKKYECNVVGFVTDNCNTMTALRTECNKVVPHIYTYGCNTHLMNLLGQALSPGTLLDDISDVNSYFRNHHYEAARLLQLKGSTPVLPCKTRWNSQCNSIRSFIKNHTKYLEISREPRSALTSNVKILETIENPSTYNSAQNLLKFLAPLANALDRLQADKATVADAVHEWIQLEELLKDNVEFKKFQEKWRKDYMSSPALAAYSLHPKYRGENLSTDDFNKVSSWLESKNNSVLVASLKLSTKDSNYFPQFLLKEETLQNFSGEEWWNIAAKRNLLPDGVTSFILKLMILPASTSALERCFSTLGNIITKKRNRLGILKAEKLCICNRMLAMENENDDSDDEL